MAEKGGYRPGPKVEDTLLLPVLKARLDTC